SETDKHAGRDAVFRQDTVVHAGTLVESQASGSALSGLRVIVRVAQTAANVLPLEIFFQRCSKNQLAALIQPGTRQRASFLKSEFPRATDQPADGNEELVLGQRLAGGCGRTASGIVARVGAEVLAGLAFGRTLLFLHFLAAGGQGQECGRSLHSKLCCVFDGGPKSS